MTTTDSTEFDARCAGGSTALRAMVDFLRTVAAHASPLVESPTFEVRGVGVTYWADGRRFCRFDPKAEADHVGVFVPGGNIEQLRRAGEVSDRDDGPWLTVKDMRGAVRLVPEILAACDRALGSRVGKEGVA